MKKDTHPQSHFCWSKSYKVLLRTLGNTHKCPVRDNFEESLLLTQTSKLKNKCRSEKLLIISIELCYY